MGYNKIHASGSVEPPFIKKVKLRKQPLKVFHGKVKK